jgi:hypothetical protein
MCGIYLCQSQYDARGRIVKTEDQCIRTFYKYDHKGNRFLERKRYSCPQYGALGDCNEQNLYEIAEHFTYNHQGRIIKISEEHFNVSDNGKSRDKINNRNGRIWTYFPNEH